jgi:hypothetical protein
MAISVNLKLIAAEDVIATLNDHSVMCPNCQSNSNIRITYFDHPCRIQWECEKCHWESVNAVANDIYDATISLGSNNHNVAPDATGSSTSSPNYVGTVIAADLPGHSHSSIPYDHPSHFCLNCGKPTSWMAETDGIMRMCTCGYRAKIQRGMVWHEEPEVTPPKEKEKKEDKPKKPLLRSIDF